jgi:hypothetical protein
MLPSKPKCMVIGTALGKPLLKLIKLFLLMINTIAQTYSNFNQWMDNISVKHDR